MNRDKQKCENCLHYRACLLNSEYVPSPCSMFEDKAGYRKASDVAREIIKDLVKFADDKERQMSIHGHSVWYIDADDVTDFIAELKKKYTEGEG